MSKAHQFGGPWTDEKVRRLAEYLKQYTTIFRRNERARFFTTNYVDAFAGTGYREQRASTPEGQLAVPLLLDGDALALKKGSARLALETQPGFDRYVLIEQHGGRAKALQSLRDEFPHLAESIQVVHAEANSYLTEWTARLDWGRNRAVVFLDGYGLEVEWRLIEALGATQGVDMWILVPVSGFSRLLTRGKYPPDDFAAALTRSLGTEDWRAFYRPTGQLHWGFEEEDATLRVDLSALMEFVLDRLRAAFFAVASNYFILYNSQRIPLYALCFASGNPKGSVTALRIANHILGK
jgi:three-Cys-motif partner protein